MSVLRSGIAVILLVGFSACSSTPATRAEEGRTQPEDLGLSSERLARLDAFLRSEIATGRKAGAAVLIVRQGKVAYQEVYGRANVEGDSPLRPDSYFRMYSTTKPIVSVALLMLYEEGHFQLTDPLEKFIPGLRGVQVYVGDDAAGKMILEAARRKPTVQDAFRHTAGFGLWSLPAYPPQSTIDRAYADAGIDLGTFDSIRDVIENKLPSVPLLYHPGEKWVYSLSHSVQAYLVEYFSGVPIDEFLQKRLFDPLEMTDTFYGDPPSEDPRHTTVYRLSEQGDLLPVDAPLGVPHDRFGDHPIGGGGLTMTLHDYSRFAQMLLNGGELDGVRILAPTTINLMTINHLPMEAQRSFGEGSGYGLGVGVRLSRAFAGNLGSEGQYGWGGAATTAVTIDPVEELILLVFAQHVPQDSDFINKVETLTYQSIVGR